MSGTNTNNTGDIQQRADKIDDSASTIRGMKTLLDSHRQQLAQHWQGVLSGAFAKVVVVYDDELTKVLTSLETIHEMLVHSKITYDSNEQQQQEAVTAIEAALAG